MSRRRLRAAGGSLAFLALAPGVVAGLVPWLLTAWDAQEPLPHWQPLRLAGFVLLTAGCGALVHAFARFVLEGVGTPAPVAPTERLVVGGLYRYVRNPMYLAVTATIAGQALVLGRPILFVYALAFLATVATFVHAYEEPRLQARFGDQYARYRAAVPAWLPRRTAWHGDA